MLGLGVPDLALCIFALGEEVATVTVWTVVARGVDEHLLEHCSTLEKGRVETEEIIHESPEVVDLRGPTGEASTPGFEDSIDRAPIEPTVDEDLCSEPALFG